METPRTEKRQTRTRMYTEGPRRDKDLQHTHTHTHEQTRDTGGLPDTRGDTHPGTNTDTQRDRRESQPHTCTHSQPQASPSPVRPPPEPRSVSRSPSPVRAPTPHAVTSGERPASAGPADRTAPARSGLPQFPEALRGTGRALRGRPESEWRTRGSTSLQSPRHKVNKTGFVRELGRQGEGSEVDQGAGGKYRRARVPGRNGFSGECGRRARGGFGAVGSWGLRGVSWGGSRDKVIAEKAGRVWWRKRS